MAPLHIPSLRAGIIVFVIAALIRITFDLAFPRPLASDEIDYDRLGSTLARTGTYTASGQPTAYRAIGYPAFVSGIYVLFGDRPQVVKIFQAVLDSCTAVMLLFLVESMTPSQALCTAGLWVCFPAAILFACQLFSETLFTFGLVGACLLLCRARENSLTALLTGLLLGCLVLIKPIALPLAILAPVVRKGRRTLWIASVIGISLVPVFGWVLRNSVVLRSPVLTTSTGVNLLIGNNPNATGGYSAPPIGNRGSDEVIAGRQAQTLAIRYISENPAKSAILCFRKALFLLTSEAELEVGHFSGAANEGMRLRERLRRVPLAIRLLVSVPSALVLILGIFGLGSRPSDCLTPVFWITCIVILLTTVVFFGGSRFRFPLMPFLAIFAVEFLSNPRARVGSLLHRRFALIAVSLAVLACLGVWVQEIKSLYL